MDRFLSVYGGKDFPLSVSFSVCKLVKIQPSLPLLFSLPPHLFERAARP